jgi:hypothetical protein
MGARVEDFSGPKKTAPLSSANARSDTKGTDGLRAAAARLMIVAAPGTGSPWHSYTRLRESI